ncbi:MAG: trypsin-like peptidase domain-containing protein [Parvibaculaceae bacterium]
MRKLLSVASALLLAGCMTSNVSLEGPRVINVEGTASPAGTVLKANMNGLVTMTGPSYVTVIVNEAQKHNRNAADVLPDALTSGSGFVVDTKGHVMTAGHVAVAAGYTVDARGADGRLYRGKVLAVSKSPDMALIELSGFTGTPVTVASTPCLSQGDPVFSLGKPHAQGDTARIGTLESMSFGRAVSYTGFGYPDAMVLRMSTRKGESGGPLFNSRGELTGMVVSTLSDGNGRPLNLAHALPSPDIAQFLCKNISCSPQWRAVIDIDIRRCST